MVWIIAGSVSSVPSSSTTWPVTKVPDDTGAGLLAPAPGKDPGEVELGAPIEGLPPPPRCAKANALKARMRNEPRSRSIRMTRPNACSRVYALYRKRKKIYCALVKDFTNASSGFDGCDEDPRSHVGVLKFSAL